MSQTLVCMACGNDWEVSPEDPDATLSDALEHAHRRHPAHDPIKLIQEGEDR
jgi:hypothetical protein